MTGGFHLSLHDAVFAPWMLLGVVWLVASFTTKRTAQREPTTRRVAYGLPILAGAALLFTHVLGDVAPVLDARVVPAGDAFFFAGLAVSAAGVAFALWARAALGRNWSGAVTVKQDHELVTSGPYGFVRHPIYTGIVLALIGSAMSVGTVRGLVALPLFVGAFAYKLSFEEALMRAQFGEGHAAWCARTKRLVPFVW